MNKLLILVMGLHFGISISLSNMYGNEKPTIWLNNTVHKSISSFSDSLIQEIMNQVSVDSITAYIQRLQDFGTRYAYTDSCKKAAEYLYSLFERWGLEMEYDYFAGEKLNDIWFDSTGQIGWACGDVGVICKTIDGGNTWEIFNLGIKQNLKGLDAINCDNVWIVGDAVAIHTDDSGTTWDVQTNPGGGESGYGWEEVDFVDQLHGWIVTWLGCNILRTTDGGITWFNKEDNGSCFNYYSDIQFVDRLIGWRSAEGGAKKTINGGQNWTLTKVGENLEFYGIYFLNTNEGWIVGEKGRIYHTINGGVQWERQSSPINFDLYAVYFINNQQGWAVGKYGTILHTLNGGVNWNLVEGISTEDFREVFFINSMRGWIVGHYETIFYTEDGGVTWIPKSVDTNIKKWSNVVARIQGKMNPDRKYVVCGHYDTIVKGSQWGYPYDFAPGANDNASGTAAVLEAARILSNYTFNTSIEFVGFTAEELGCLGSLRYVHDEYVKNSDIQFALNFDVIGANVDNNKVRVSYSRDSLNVADLISSLMSRYTDLLPQVYESTLSDQYSFEQYGFPSIGIYQVGIPPNWHRPTDLISTLDFEYLSKIIKVSTASLAILAEAVTTDTRDEECIGFLPKRYRLYQNYPNPFNATTTIKYLLPKSSIVTLKIFNLAGQEIQTLVNEYLNAGEHEIKWTAKELPSGIYFYRLQAGNFSEIKKIILQK